MIQSRIMVLPAAKPTGLVEANCLSSSSLMEVLNEAQNNFSKKGNAQRRGCVSPNHLTKGTSPPFHLIFAAAGLLGPDLVMRRLETSQLDCQAVESAYSREWACSQISPIGTAALPSQF